MPLLIKEKLLKLPFDLTKINKCGYVNSPSGCKNDLCTHWHNINEFNEITKWFESNKRPDNNNTILCHFKNNCTNNKCTYAHKAENILQKINTINKWNIDYNNFYKNLINKRNIKS